MNNSILFQLIKEHKYIEFKEFIKKNEDIEIKLDDTNIFHKIEVSDIKFLSHNDAYKNIRDFHIEKINIINSLVDFILYNIRYYDKFYKKNNILI